MNLKQYLLLCLGEEGTEISQASSKAMRFGLDSVYNGESNLDHLIIEINDLIGVIEFSQEYDILPKQIFDDELIKAKKEKLLRMINLSKEFGHIE